MRKLFSKRKTILISIFSFLLLIVSAISIIALFNGNNKGENPKFRYNSGYYNDDRNGITTSTLNSEYQKMNTLYTATGSTIARSSVAIDTNKTIAIETALDFYAFVELANTNNAFLTYNYELFASIDMNKELGSTFQVNPIGYQNKKFTGTFNGNGHTIKNLVLKPVTTEGTAFNNTHYYALFSQVGRDGVVANFGLIDPVISIASTPASSTSENGIYYISNVVGLNEGTVSFVYVRDNLEAEEKSTPAGIDVINAGFHIAGLVAVNNGTFSNSYYASTTVISSSNTKPAEFQEIMLSGTAPTNTYFYNELIEEYASTAVKYGGFIDRTFNYNTRYGTYCSSLDVLNSSVLTTTASASINGNKWYMGSSYADIEDLSTFFDSVITPTTQGFRINQVEFNSTDNKYHVDITSTADFSYIYELMDQNSKFASNSFVYELTSDINLDNVLSPKYSNGIAATFRTKGATDSTEAGDYKKLVLRTFAYKVTVLGYEAYGVFPYLTGTVEYLNFIVSDGNNTITFDKTAENANNTNNVIAYGAIAGYVEGGTVRKCNVYNDITAASSIGKYYFGGAVGVLGGEGTVEDVITSGSILMTNSGAKTITELTDRVEGVCLGGVIGYVESSLGSVNKLLNTTTLDIQGYSSTTLNVGGVIGAAFFKNASELENKATVTVGNAYNYLYASGVIGRLLGVSNQITMMTNNGNINVTQANKPTYVTGVLNADIKTSGNIGISVFKQRSAFYFYASALSNGATITILGVKATTCMHSNVINVMNNNGFITKLSGIYNLNYTFNADTTSLGAQAINMSIINEFAPVLNSNSANSSYYIDLTTAYNLRDISYTTTANISNALLYTGCVLGNYINYRDVRNEGNISLTNGSYTITGNVTVTGLFNELSSSFYARSVYNGGDININYTATITGNVNVSGICYANRNGITNINEYNPSSVDYDSSLIGSLNDVINNGNIKVSSTLFSGITYNYYWQRTANERSVAANIIYTTYSGAKIIGNINVSGITTINASVITNAFNLGDITALNYITETNVNNRRQINAGGISSLNIGQYAYVINSANNGDIIAANLASYSYTTTSGTALDSFGSSNVSKSGMINATTYYYSDVTVGGIVSRNDKNEDGSNYASSASNSSQVISFTINYGSIYAYNFIETNSIASTLTSCKAAGIIGSGLCNVINVNNYGSVYSGDVSAGIFGLVSLSSFATEVNSNTIYIANTLNYGNIYSLMHAYDKFELAIPSGLVIIPVSDDLSHPKYSNFVGNSLSDFKFITKNSNTIYKYYSGSIIGIIDYNTLASAATNIIIRYLVSFNENLSISGAEISVNSAVTANTTTIFSPYLNPDQDGYKDRDDYLATNVQYAPLSSGYVKSDFLKTNSTSGGHSIWTFYGVFNENFIFRKVLNGEYEDGSTVDYFGTNVSYFNTTTYKTDRFLADFFQFVPYAYVNDALMDKIGWKTSAYLDAANKFANSLEGTSLLYTTLGSTVLNTDLVEALQTNTWSQYANPEILTQLVDILLEGQNKTVLLSYLEYIFSDSNDYSFIFTNELRGTIVDYVYENYSSLIDVSELLNFANGYSTILANALCSDATNAVKTDLINHISDYIRELSGVTQKELLLAFVDYLKSNGDSYFTATSKTSKYDLLLNLFNNIDEDNSIDTESFYSTLLSLFSDANKTIINGTTASLAGYGAFKNISAPAKVTFFESVISNNDYARLSNYLDDFATEIGLFDYLRNDGYDEQSFSALQSNIAYTSTTNTNTDVTEARVKLWNKIKDTNTFKNWFTTLNFGTKYYLATEVNNTYQTDSAPIPSLNIGTEMVNLPNPNEYGVSSDLNFIYTTTVTPNTYFYGPYATNTGDNTKIPNGDGTTVSNTNQGTVLINQINNISSNSVPSGNSGYYSTPTPTTNWYSVLFTDGAADTSIRSVATGNTGITVNDRPLVILRRTEVGAIDNSTLTNNPKDGLTYQTIKTNDYIIDSNNNKQTLNYVFVRRPKTSSRNFVLGNSNVNCQSNNVTYTIYDGLTDQPRAGLSNLNNWSYILNNYVYNINVNCVNTNWHSTGRTGLYVRFVSTGTQHRIDYDTQSMFTTRYIDYNASQLLKLDGYLTNYGDGTTVSADEKDIINKVFNEILLTSGTRRTQFLQVVEKALFETLGTTNTTNHINFIDNFVSNGVTTTTKVDNTTAPFDYLYYTYTSNTNNMTINQYLSSLSTDDDNKKKILNAAANNKNVFAELIEILFDESRTSGADTSWQPGTGYGSSIDLQALFEARGGNTTTNTTVSIGNRSSFPIITSSSTIISDNNTTNAYSPDGSNYSTMEYATTQTASTKNIGYFTGSNDNTNSYGAELVYNTSIDYSKFYAPNDTSNSTELDYSSIPAKVKEYLAEKGNYMIRLTSGSQMTYNNADSYYVVRNGQLGSYSGAVLVPRNSIIVSPTTPGTFQFVVVGVQQCGFRVSRLVRRTAKNYSTNLLNNPKTLVECNNMILPGKAYYFSYNISQEDIDAGYEYVINSGDGYRPYISYIDVGAAQNEEELIASKTYYIQNSIDDYDDDFLNQIISYLTPLDAGSQNIYSKATSYNANTTYYSLVDGSYEVASGVDSTNYSNYYVVNATISDYQRLAFCSRFMKLLAASSNEATYTLIHSLDDRDAFEDILKYLVSKDTRNFDAIIKYANTNNLFPQDFEKYLTGGWLATDYYRKYKTDISTTILKNRIETYLSTYQYITGAQSIDTEQFISFCEHIGYPLEMNYGIFALASNEGIQNGVFIPDNLNLDTMDPEYKVDSNVNYVLTDATENVVSDASWRGGTPSNEDSITGYNGTNVTVNQAFYIEMKQLNKSISTVVFDLTLTNGVNTYYGDIDLKNATITYYVPSLTSVTYTVSNIDLAYHAISKDGKVTVTTGADFGLNSTFDVSNLNTTAKQFTVFAEDRRVYKTYSIIFKQLSTELTMKYDPSIADTTHVLSNSNETLTVASSQEDTTVKLNITSTNTKLPKGFNLKPYLTLVGNGNTYRMDTEYVTISTLSTDHRVKADGSAVATLVISYKLPAGTYKINLTICGETVEVTYIKQASNACELTLKYNNTNVSFTNYAATTNIPFGRAYNNIELTDINGLYSNYYDFYADSYTLSANATVEASVTKNLTQKTYNFDSETSINYYITSYVVTYVVTAENGTTSNTYTHTLTELDPYINNMGYADLYGDGSNINNLANITFSTAEGYENQTEVSFERGHNVYYRIKYNFANIYTLSNNIVYSKEETTESTLAGIATFNIEYRGLSVDVNDDCDAGTYTFIYKYQNTQEWGLTAVIDAETGLVTSFTKDTDTYIEFTFPRIVINKTYSTDATLHTIVLMDAYTVLSNASTVMDVESLRPVESGNGITYDANEQYYHTLYGSSEDSGQSGNKIAVGTPINYAQSGTDYSTAGYKDYFAVGTVSNAQLGNYAPSFTLESHALIFQTTTLAKLKTYGKDNNQSSSDYSILTDHTSEDGSQIFIYLPFTYQTTRDGQTVTATKIFLAKLENKTITSIYDDTFNGTGNAVATMSLTLDDIRVLKKSTNPVWPTVTISGETYTLASCVGDRIDNQSLYMDYIGNPLDNHFWFVSYVVFSEDYIRSNQATWIKFFHIALIDITNNVYFSIKVVTPNDAIFTDIDDIYVTVVGYRKDPNNDSNFIEGVVGTYVAKATVDTTNNTITYELVYSVQILPSAYYFFYIDLPGGYEAVVEITDPAKVFKEGTSADYLGHIADYTGAYLPPSSIVVQRVPLTITVSRGTDEDSAWAIATSDIYTRKATLIVREQDNND